MLDGVLGRTFVTKNQAPAPRTRKMPTQRERRTESLPLDRLPGAAAPPVTPVGGDPGCTIESRRPAVRPDHHVHRACHIGARRPRRSLINLFGVELEEEMSTSDVVLLLSSVPERTSDLVYWLDEARLRYRHGPAFPTLGSLIAHLVDSAPKVDGLLRHAHLDGQKTADVRAAIDPGHDQDLTLPLQEALEDFARVRRRTVDLLHGWGRPEWERTITDPRGAEMSLLEVCRLVAKHEMAHVAQIRNLSALLPEPQDLGPVRPIRVNGQ